MFYLGRVVTQRMPASAAMGCGLDGMPVSVAVVQLSVLLGGTKCLTVAWLSSSSVSCVTNSGTGAKLAVQARVALLRKRSREHAPVLTIPPHRLTQPRCRLLWAASPARATRASHTIRQSSRARRRQMRRLAAARRSPSRVSTSASRTRHSQRVSEARAQYSPLHPIPALHCAQLRVLAC